MILNIAQFPAKESHIDGSISFLMDYIQSPTLPYIKEIRQSLYKICLDICTHYNADVSKVRGRSRKEEVVYIRYQFIIAARDCEYTTIEIGDFLGRDHSSIVHFLNNYKVPRNIKSKIANM